ncbi:MAG: M20 family metallopeptidase [Candidatus Aminicenantia bacterium]
MRLIRIKNLWLIFLVLFFSLTLLGVDQSASQKIEQETENIKENLVKIRRQLHQNPELSNREFETSKLVAGYLKSLGLEVKTGIAHTGVVGLLKGAESGITVALRADMDALPIQELNNVPYKSKNPGVMHACGHDFHTTIGLGTATVLSKIKDKIKGNIKFIFQPAEEGAPPGEEGGASLMIKEEVLKNPEVSVIFGLHVFPLLDVSTMGYKPESFMAQANRFEIEVLGKKTHGASPHLGIDPIVIASEVVLAFQTITSRQIDAREPVVLSVGIIEGGNRFNIIADKVKLVGTVRVFNPKTNQEVRSRMERIVKGITESYGANYTFKYNEGAPPVNNDPNLVKESISVIEKLVGSQNVILLKPQMFAEDFSYYALKVPGFFYFLGVRNEEKGLVNMLHTPYFNGDEKCIPLGIKLMCHLLLNYLESHKKLDN